MTRYLLDSDITIDYELGASSIRPVVEPLVADGLAISAVTFMEVYQGLLRLPDPLLAEGRLLRLLGDAAVLAVDVTVARRCATIRADLQSRGRSIRHRALDLIIAATAVEHGLTLVTRNVDDYDDIRGLKLLTSPAS